MLSLNEIEARIKSGPHKHTASKEGPRDAAVILPLVEKRDGLHVLFEVRAMTLTAQPGETCFPGGRIDATDRSAEAAAVRELCEELGARTDDVRVMADLPAIITPQRGTIHPFIAHLQQTKQLSVNKSEVEEWFSVPLAHLLASPPKQASMKLTFEPGDDFPIERIPNRKAYETRSFLVPEYFYEYEDRIIWGLTARMLKQFLELIDARE
ncbi:NUDIX hydrolase [Shouchella shacheensis]|uniref:NUDIX hydrolase n=1 Tax=Shouchella shacheensis TaxID=1649580 RepID=UPI00073FAF03|nr:CoA pyrophosphatase [Shouchella shacheensis]